MAVELQLLWLQLSFLALMVAPQLRLMLMVAPLAARKHSKIPRVAVAVPVLLFFLGLVGNVGMNG